MLNDLSPAFLGVCEMDGSTWGRITGMRRRNIRFKRKVKKKVVKWM